MLLSNNQVNAEDTINLYSQISATPGITTPSTTDSSNTVRFTVEIPDFYDQLNYDLDHNISTNDRNYSIAIYISNGPGGDYKQINSVLIDESNIWDIRADGYTYPWTVPIGTETGTYKYMSKLFTNGVYIEGSKSNEGQLQVNSNDDLLACQEGCQLSVVADKTNLNAGEKVTFRVKYRDNTTTSPNYNLKMWVSATAGGIAEEEKCDATIRNDNTEVVCEWQTNTGTAGAGGSISGEHNIVAKVFYKGVATPPNPLYAYWSGIVNVVNPDAPADGGIEGLDPETGLAGPGPLNFGNPFDTDTLAGKITSFAMDTVGILAFLSFLVAGIIYITSGGDPAKAEKAKKTMIWSVVALVVMVLSYGIVTITINAINSIFG